mmetsp:Transcript_1840/g.3137  ORF Transcript_1840/g.3137 Transcript_1840/m.3137 type:complete len:115 (-) Transcript_1840:800-1144(-)
MLYGAPCWTITPSRMRAISSAMRMASSGSCVTSSTAVSSSLSTAKVSSRMPSRRRLSRPEKGSSISMIRGRGAKARASAIRCCSPPDSRCGYLSMAQLRFTLAKSSSTLTRFSS